MIVYCQASTCTELLLLLKASTSHIINRGYLAVVEPDFYENTNHEMTAANEQKANCLKKNHALRWMPNTHNHREESHALDPGGTSWSAIFFWKKLISNDSKTCKMT
jgi:hypothetical protein